MKVELPEIKCTGCGACVNTCNLGAISWQSQPDGFIYPIIDQEKCINCGLCMKSCHAIDFNDFHKPLSCYAAQLTDSENLFKSTSGGIFYALALSIFNLQGVVYGCAFDEGYSASIIRIESLNQIKPLHGSKYVWSNSSDSFPLVKKDLENNRIVLYTCLPCQAAGLRKYLKKNYDNLYIVDVLCGGSPSPLAYTKYLESISFGKIKSIRNFQFRDKERFGSGVDCTYIYNGKKHYETWLENSYYFAFSSRSRLSWRRSCYECDYKSVNRVSDMTIGDYWGVENYHKEFNPSDGVSVILVNTNQGIRLFDTIKNYIHFENSDVLYATKKNSLVVNNLEGHVEVPYEREAFFDTIRNAGWKEADRKYLKLRKKLLHKNRIVRIKDKIKRLIKGRK